MSNITTEIIKAATPKAKGRRGRKSRIPRTICPICKLPAVAYPHYRTLKDGVTRRKSWHFEHRDEPPIRLYKYHGQTYKVYRRCTSRTVDSNLDLDRLIAQVNKEYKTVTAAAAAAEKAKRPLTNEDYYKKLYCNLLDEFKVLQQEVKRVRSHFPDPRKDKEGEALEQ